ncbi:MAG: hypothetical protein PVI02_09960 [Gammaproteobacteria bacterium]|jgi:hypothetical protein
MSLQLLEIEDRRDLGRWVRFPGRHYRNDPNYVPQLLREEMAYFDQRRNPAFRVCRTKLFLALEDGHPVGRIAGIINSLEEQKLGRKRGRFGWFESVDNPTVANSLLGAVRDWLAAEGCVEMTGPHGFTDLDVEGLLIEGFEATPTISGCYNPPYYQGMLENFGFQKDADYLMYRFEVPDRSPFLERIKKRYAGLAEYRVVTCRSRKELRGHLTELWSVLEEAFEPLYGVVPLTPDQMDYYADKYFGFLDPALVKLVFSHEGEMAGFLIAMPNLSRAFQKANGRLFPAGFFHILKDYRRPAAADFLLAGARAGHPNGLLTALGLADMFNTLRSRGVRWVESNHELEDNSTVHQLWRRFPIVNQRRSRVFRLDLA